MELLQDQIFTLLGTLITILAGYVVKQVKGYLDKKGIIKELESKRVYADIAVKAAKDMYQEADGEIKLEAAKEFLLSTLNSKGIPITEDELDSLVRAAYQGAKEGLK